MSSRNASRLEAGLIARKGEASPARPTQQSAPAVPDERVGTQPAGTGPSRSASRGMQGTIAVTVRLDPSRYERLKVHGARRRQTNQDILVEALDRYFASNPE